MNAVRKTGKRLKTQALALEIPSSEAEAAKLLGEIGSLGRTLSVNLAEMNDEIGQITAKYQPTIETLEKTIKAKTEGLQIWCETNRDRLTNEGKVKSYNLVTGLIGWRTKPPSVKVSGIESVLEMLKKMRLTRFIRTKEEIAKDAILNEPKAVAGIPGIEIITGREDFYLEPFEQEGSSL